MISPNWVLTYQKGFADNSEQESVILETPPDDNEASSMQETAADSVQPEPMSAPSDETDPASEEDVTVIEEDATAVIEEDTAIELEEDATAVIEEDTATELEEDAATEGVTSFETESPMHDEAEHIDEVEEEGILPAPVSPRKKANLERKQAFASWRNKVREEIDVIRQEVSVIRSR